MQDGVTAERICVQSRLKKKVWRRGRAEQRCVCACVRGKPEAGGSQTKVREGWEECEEEEGEEGEAVPRQTAGKES